MALIFTHTTSCLAIDFVDSFSPEKLAKCLFRVAKETGVEFSRRQRTFTVNGNWNSIVEAYKTLETILNERSNRKDDTVDKLIITEELEKTRQSQKIHHKVDEIKRGRKPGHTVKPLDYTLPEPVVFVQFQPQKSILKQLITKKCPNQSKLQKLGSKEVQEPEELGGQVKETDQNLNSKECINSQGPKLSVSNDGNLHNGLTESNTDSTLEDSSEPCTLTISSVSSLSVQPGGSETGNGVETSWIKIENVREQAYNEDEETDIDEQYLGSDSLNKDGNKSVQNDMLESTPPDDVTENNKKDKNKTIGSRKDIKKSKRKCKKNTEFKCDLCPYIGKKKETLKSHVKRTHKKKYACEICDKRFGVKKDLTRHTNVHNKSKNPKQKKKKKAEEEILDENIEYRCEKCPYIGNKKHNLNEHMKRVHRIKFECDICFKQFGFNKDLNRHKKNVHCEPQHFCEICHRLYKSKRVFEDHLKTHEADYVKPNFSCEVCEKSFTTKYVLATHIKSEHLGMKESYLCPTCGRSFTQRSSYLSHANVHAGIKPFVCDVCGKAFSYDKSLKEHKYLHDPVRHYQCHICQKTFRQRTSLRIHMNVHEDKRDYICTSCGKGFTQKQALMRHERIHSGVKPFECGLCNKFFNDLSIIRRHMLLIHKKEKTAWKKDVISNIKKQKNWFISTAEKQDTETNQSRSPSTDEPKTNHQNNNQVHQSTMESQISNSAGLNLQYPVSSSDAARASSLAGSVPINYSSQLAHTSVMQTNAEPLTSPNNSVHFTSVSTAVNVPVDMEATATQSSINTDQTRWGYGGYQAYFLESLPHMLPP